MSPHFIDPKIDYHRLRELSDEFTAHWNRLQAYLGDPSRDPWRGEDA
jgi:hypothetical protein